MFSFRINSNMIFENAQAEGEMVIECWRITIWHEGGTDPEEENEKIYATDIPPPGERYRAGQIRCSPRGGRI